MPLYDCFNLTDRKMEERFFHMSEAPKLGSEWDEDVDEIVVQNGVKKNVTTTHRLRRVIQAKHLQTNVSQDGRFVGRQMNRGDPAIDLAGLGRNAKGEPVFDGLRDVKKFEDAQMRLKEQHDPNRPVYKWGALDAGEQCEKDAVQAADMHKLKTLRHSAEAMRGIAGIDINEVYK